MNKKTKVYIKRDKLILSSKFKIDGVKHLIEIEYSIEEFDELIKDMVKKKLKLESSKWKNLTAEKTAERQIRWEIAQNV